MSEVLSGTISNALGLRNALEQITSMKEVNSGVLTVSGERVSGRLGIAWGRFITGAVLDTGESGRAALRHLLTVREGSFAFLDTEGEPVEELRQSLGIDLNGVVPYVPEEISIAVTPSLFDSDEHQEQGNREQGTEIGSEADAEDQDTNAAGSENAKPEEVEEKADRVLAELQRVVGSGQPTADEPASAEESGAEQHSLPPNVIELITTTHSSILETRTDQTSGMQPLEAAEMPPVPSSRFIPDAARLAPFGGGDAQSRGQRTRPVNHQGGDTVGIAILCVLFFVVSCAGTVIFGPRIAAVVTSAFHATH
jgi:hypothetical protein